VQGRAFGRCERCLQATLCGHLHHRRPKGLGGSKALDRHDVSNLVYLCPDCHSWAHGHPNEARWTGWLVPRSLGVAPIDEPITDLTGQTRYLDNEGQYLTAVAHVDA
jgi:5-methylcytosine-specific restriction protein A